MQRKYRLSFWRKAVNQIAIRLLKAGIPLGTTYLLTVRGRKSGLLHTIPVTLVEEGGRRWLVAPYGAVNWVKNARAAGEVTISRGKEGTTYRVKELEPAEAAPILKRYIQRVGIVRPFFSATSGAPLAAFEAEAKEHPVFLLQA
ncbi:deazaflavin-dependent oxidoreductase (nitroreductase family) [Thermosporothrix hazakensis]|jgi:deazaflavin-dependent oxidoreductase (nitroreductase family)|uniref:Deazaflavin-dependent oxidoreductase (Nitroreductase family) n=1 Tax=Thermosporothrix hazakensis TaxID=644383 RepID=A0A326U7E7_THEHA|nr:nitroreductase family deazaflavin-dependent oxidoreductase [Thermosporothrix hazakensis]PZW29452.1 deazaflavin-dependent oxidoreductase (nitroreductase family) [Thermosporothrix hazakensis]GCE45832.1 hypothetical protein KTH_07010 [Thermosporothrix hazakensis]